MKTLLMAFDEFFALFFLFGFFSQELFLSDNFIFPVRKLGRHKASVNGNLRQIQLQAVVKMGLM